jgi:antibiotic biosynthesis monooxygenase (ABM) superfamily enzyme
MHLKPITTILKIRYKEGCKDECLQWMLETASVASSFEGFLEKNISISVENERELLNIFTFSDNESLQKWESSEQRLVQTVKGNVYYEAITQKTQLGGLEFMFPSTKNPKRWKMVIVTVCVIFTLLNTLVPILQQLFIIMHLPYLLKSLLGVVIMVGLMTYIILPFLSKLLYKWLKS